MIGVKSQIFVQPTGIELDCYQSIDPEAIETLRQQLQLGPEPVLVCVSRLSKENNVDFITDGYKTLLHPGDWADRVEQILADPQLRQQLSANAAQFASRYGIEQFGQKVAQAYAQVLASRPSSRP